MFGCMCLIPPNLYSIKELATLVLPAGLRLSLQPSPAIASDLTSRVSVINEDTSEIHAECIRLERVDAPESGQSCTDTEGCDCPSGSHPDLLCRSAQSWEQRINENTNGLRRQYLSKGHVVSGFTHEELDTECLDTEHLPMEVARIHVHG